MLGVKALRSTEVRAWRGLRPLPATAMGNHQRDLAHQRAKALFRWLLRACMLYELYRW